MRASFRHHWLLAACVALVGCGAGHAARSGRATAASPPASLPRGVAAIVGASRISDAQVNHWLPIVFSERALPGWPLPSPPRYTACVRNRQAKRVKGSTQALLGMCEHEYGTALKEAASFLIRDQWLMLEAAAEGVNDALLARAVSRAIKQASPRPGMTRTDLAFETRVRIVEKGLEARHSQPQPVTPQEVAAYYSGHEGEFIRPAVRSTLIVVTHTAEAASIARAALVKGEPWRTVAKRWSIDSSREVGGVFAVVEGEQPRRLERAVFGAPLGRTVGPIAIPSEQGGAADYYVFKVTGVHERTRKPLIEVAHEIRAVLIEHSEASEWTTFVSGFRRRWRSRTVCAPVYVVPECRNYQRSTQ